MTRSPTIVLVPGLGADARLFDLQKPEFSGLIVPPWLTPVREETLPQYAARLAASVGPIEGPFVLGGASFGGMLALEMARHLRPSALALIGSATRGRDVRVWLRAFERIGHHLPGRAIDAGRVLTPIMAPIVSSASRFDVELFLDMLRQTPTEFIRWSARAIMRWRWEGDPGLTVHRLHGSADLIIRPPRTDDARIVRGAGHVLSMSHPRETNEFLAELVERSCAPAGRA